MPSLRRYTAAPVQNDPPLKKGSFTMEDSIMEMKDLSPIMMQMFKGTESTIAKGFGGKADYSDPAFKMMVMSGADARCAPRCFPAAAPSPPIWPRGCWPWPTATR